MSQDKDRLLLLWLWLGLNTEPQGKSRQLLLNHFSGRIEDIFDADDYSAIEKLSETTAEKLKNKNLDGAYKVIENCQNEGINIIPPSSKFYPERLKNISDFPAVLYHLGRPIPSADNFFCAVVGTRNMTEYGADCAYSISYDMTKAGAVIVSGMADGIDGTAQRARLDAGGFTVAVLGNGLDRCYPADHKMLMDEIIERGCVISEFKPYTKPEKFNFPTRNRIISGLCQATLVVEAPEKSGALNTATHAIKQHRALYAVPGKIGEFTNEGTNGLIKEGAKGITSGGEIIADFEERYPCISRERIPSEKVHANIPSMSAKVKIRKRKATEPISTEQDEVSRAITEIFTSPKKEEKQVSEIKNNSLLCDVDGSERIILEKLLLGKAMSPDEIAQSTSLPISEVACSLTMLEIKGKIVLLPGERYTVI